METLKTSIFSFIIVNLVNKGILHFLITMEINDSSTDCSTKESIHENAECINFQFHNVKFSQESYFALSCYYSHWYMYERSSDSWLRRALWRKIMEILKALILTITVINLVSKGLSFHYTAIFTGPSILYRTLRYKQFIVTFIDSSNRYIEVGLRSRALLKIRHSDTGFPVKFVKFLRTSFL